MADDLLLKIAQKIVGKVGNEFLLALVENLRDAMDASWVFIAEGSGDPPSHAHMRCSVRNGVEAEPITYDLEGTPCKFIFDGDADQVLVPKALWKKFPKEVGFESYCAAPIHDLSGRVSGILAVISENSIRDMTRAGEIIRLFSSRAEAELNRIEYETNLEKTISRLERQRDMLNKANGFKSDLLAMIAHDMRNPLQALVSSGELIKSYNNVGDASSEDYRAKIEKSCDVIMRTTDRMEKMIALMMTNGRDNATSFRAHCTHVPLIRPVTTVIGLRTDAALGKNIELSQTIDPKLHAWVDEDLLIEALDNLIGNAIKFSPFGKTVTIKSKQLENNAELKIIDQGQGMERHEFEQAFKPYVTASSRPTAGEKSTGLGLAIVRSIAEAHAGTIHVESTGKEEGCIFTLSLPLSGGALPV